MKHYTDIFDIGSIHFSQEGYTYVILNKRKTRKNYYVKCLITHKGNTSIIELPLPVLLSELNYPL